MHQMEQEKIMSEEIERSEALTKISELIKDVRIAMLATITPQGTIHSRPMATQKGDFAGSLMFLTRQHSAKTDEIVHDSQVTLTYADGKSLFVTLAGRATLSKDKATIHELWNPLYKAWFPDGEEDPEITVIRVDVDQAEYWEAPSNSVVRGYQLLKAAATKGGSKVGQHEVVTL
jgi:general stress protein 26